MVSRVAFTVLVGAVVLERAAELAVARRNARWLFCRGGREHGAGHYPAMVALHAALFGGALVEVWLLRRPAPAFALVALAVVLASQALRWWCIATLGRRWCTRVIVVPEAPVQAGPYRWLRHPNYLAVAAEGLALPLVHGAWLTAFAFTALNGMLLRVRIACEERALEGCALEEPR